MSVSEQLLVRVLAILVLVGAVWLVAIAIREETIMTPAERAARCAAARAAHAEYPSYNNGQNARYFCRCGPPSRPAPVYPHTNLFVTPGARIPPQFADPGCE